MAVVSDRLTADMLLETMQVNLAGIGIVGLKEALPEMSDTGILVGLMLLQIEGLAVEFEGRWKAVK